MPNVSLFISRSHQTLRLCTVLLLTSTITSTALSGDFTYTVNGDVATITGYYNASPMPEFISVIPSVIGGKTVTSIGASAFYNPSPMSGYMMAASITIPDSVTNIGYRAFGNNMNLWDVTIGNGVVSIGDYAFASCPVTNLTMGANVRYIGNYAFYWCGFSDVRLPDCLVSIGNSAFNQCISLTNLTMGTNLTTIGNSAFSFCPGLKNVELSASITNIGSSAFAYCSQLSRITFIPDSPAIIGSQAFYASALTNVTLGANVTSIGSSAFQGCAGLTDIYFCGNAPEIGSFVFLETSPAAVVYYKENTAGWETLFSGIPTISWAPQIQTGNTDFGVRSNRFGFTITGTTNFAVRIEACTNLAQGIWAPVETAALNNGTLSFSDPAFTNYPNRYYRVSMPQ